MGDQNNIDDWYDPSGLKSLRLDMKSASSMTNTAQIVLQTLRYTKQGHPHSQQGVRYEVDSL